MTVPAEHLRERRRSEDHPDDDPWHVVRENGDVSDRERTFEGVSVPDALHELTAVESEELGRRGRVHEAVLRVLNLSVAALALLVLAPVFLVIAVAIKLDSDGPVFYRQLRVGVDRRRDGGGAARDDGRRTGDLGGRPFVLYKFRTMHTGAEDDVGPAWSSHEDDRVTRVGRFLRRHRLDELPQLWNVVKGDMAIVGPRPERPAFFQKLRQVFDAYPKRQTVPPGITGWAQVNQDADQSLDDVEHKLRYDLHYLQRRSVWFDVYVMLKTPVVMVRREVLTREGSVGGNGDSAGKATSEEER